MSIRTMGGTGARAVSKMITTALAAFLIMGLQLRTVSSCPKPRPLNGTRMKAALDIGPVGHPVGVTARCSHSSAGLSRAAGHITTGREM